MNDFEKDFPSLKNARLTIDGELLELKYENGEKGYAYRHQEVQKHYIDKQKVRDILNRYDDHDEIILDDLKKREFGV